MKCFYHNADLDGFCSAAIVKYHYPECELFGVDYGININLNDIISKHEGVFVVDFSFDEKEMLFLNENTDFIWIDHHKTSIDKFSKFNFNGIQRIGIGACALVSEYFGMPYNYAVDMLSLYDVWRFEEGGPFCLYFQYGMRIENNDPKHNMGIWVRLFTCDSTSSFVKEIIDNGKAVLKYQERQDEKYAKSMAFEVDFEGYNAIVLNKAWSNSKVFDSIFNKDKHDIMILFSYEGVNKIKYSIYSNNDIDVSKIALKYGGGGHKNACGFYSTEYLF
jgi:oligoribonuclease NrnB/cAMP/cGMP phosphodiesterase (DHH superfamily)